LRISKLRQLWFKTKILIQKFDQRLNEEKKHKTRLSLKDRRSSKVQTGFVLVANPDPGCRNPTWIKGEKFRDGSSKGPVKNFLATFVGGFNLLDQFADFFKCGIVEEILHFSIGNSDRQPNWIFIRSPSTDPSMQIRTWIVTICLPFICRYSKR
jgi:hypothetical protein